jgi:CO/xanthine dehydrogenase FAD-binding subunit
MTLTRDAILAVNDTILTSVEVPEWGGTVYVRPMTGRDRDAYDMELVNSGGKIENMRARLAVRVVCDANGELMFKPDDAELLGKKNARALDRIYAAMESSSKVTSEGVESLKKD